MSATYSPPAGMFDEAFQKGVARPHWQEFFKRLDLLGEKEFRKRTSQADEFLDENGVTYGAISDQATTQRPWKLDLIPLILDEPTWQTIERGIAQRTRLYDLLIRDLYGEQKTLREGWLAPETVYAHSGFLLPAIGLHERERSLVYYAAELARSPDGRFWVMADRSDSPMGVGFALENRIISNRTIPHLSKSCQTRKLSPFFVQLKQTLKALSPRKVEHPRIALLSPGPSNPNYFEDVYLARYLSYDLTQGSDLAVRDDFVYLKTLAGLLPVDVLLLRGNESELDPVEFGGGATHGVPGLLQAIRAGNVATVNVPGCGIIEAPVFKSQLPKLCRQLLGEELQLPSIATWWCQIPESREYVFENLRSLVVKPAFTASGGEEIIGADLSAEEIDSLRRRIEQNPHAFVAQELIARSAVPMLSAEGGLQPGHVALRVFAVAGEDGYSVMPGGLVRVSDSSGPMELSIAGGMTSKDLWVLTSEPDEAVSLLPTEHYNVTLKRTSAMFPSRVADDLFWLGRSIEKSDLLARMIRSLLTRIEMSNLTISNESLSLTRALAVIGAIEPGFAIGEMARSLPKLSEAIGSITSDTSQTNGLAQAVSEIMRLSSLVRDWISPETWQQLHRTGTEFFNPLAESSDLGTLADTFDDLILTLASVMGLIDNGMIRGPAWRFLDIGRRIERARTTAVFVRSMIESGKFQDVATLKMIIEISDCQMTYRSRYLDDVQQNAVFDLCVTDITNPRSIASQLNLIADHVDALPNHTNEALRNTEKRLAMAALHAVRMLTSDDLGEKSSRGLISILSQVEGSMRELSKVLEQKYLLHSGTPRQLVDTAGAIS
ncbi:MAG TPA: circularly permuted type 2 ATP-grasp protein [Planctomycetaceae bacterium]|nr:circularly permuted type 2 ATP-grasp protein [Planctomycetaceae bacterium]